MRKRYRSRWIAAMVVIAAVCVLAVRFRFLDRIVQSISGTDPNIAIFRVPTLEARNDLDTIRSLDRLILLIDNNIALQARHSRIVMVQLINAVNQDQNPAEIEFRRIDICADQSSDLNDGVLDWLFEQHADGGIMGSGNGAVVWVQKGKVIETVDFAGAAGIERLLSITHQAFPEFPLPE